jgi:hypothetical protein
MGGRPEPGGGMATCRPLRKREADCRRGVEPPHTARASAPRAVRARARAARQAHVRGAHAPERVRRPR